MRPARSFHAGYMSFSPSNLSAQLPVHPTTHPPLFSPHPHTTTCLPTEGEDAPNHQSAVCHRGLGQRHAGLSVSPDRTAVPSGYPHTSNLTPMIFTRRAEN